MLLTLRKILVILNGIHFDVNVRFYSFSLYLDNKTWKVNLTQKSTFAKLKTQFKRIIIFLLELRRTTEYSSLNSLILLWSHFFRILPWCYRAPGWFSFFNLIQLFYNEWEHYQFSPLYNDISVLCKLNNIVVTIWWLTNIKYTSTDSLKLFIGHR